MNLIKINEAKLFEIKAGQATEQVQERLDSFAKTRGYDGIMSACTYATSTNARFAAEGQYCVEARDATWAKLYQILEEVQAGSRLTPNNYEELEAELPNLSWPS